LGTVRRSGKGDKKIVTVKVKNLDKHAGWLGSISQLAPRVYLDFFVFTVTIKMWGQNYGIIARKSKKDYLSCKKIAYYLSLY
jgi:hypothetical protein